MQTPRVLLPGVLMSYFMLDEGVCTDMTEFAQSHSLLTMFFLRFMFYSGCHAKSKFTVASISISCWVIFLTWMELVGL